MNPTRIRARLGRAAREPLLHFVFLGALIWAGFEHWNSLSERYVIRIAPAEEELIALSYRQQFGLFPTKPEMQALIDRHIREEIFMREGLALSLDKGDEIVRRRIIQKYEFLQMDEMAPNAPDIAVLRRWFEQNRTRYLTPARITFSQIYFSVAGTGDRAAKDRGVRVLDKLRELRVTRAPHFGDAFPGPSDVAGLTPEDALRLFGNSELSQALFKLPLGQWEGPYRSGYGWHLVFVTDHQPAALPALAEIQARVLADYLEEQSRILAERAFGQLRARYRVVYGGSPQQVIPVQARIVTEAGLNW